MGQPQYKHARWIASTGGYSCSKHFFIMCCLQTRCCKKEENYSLMKSGSSSVFLLLFHAGALLFFNGGASGRSFHEVLAFDGLGAAEESLGADEEYPGWLSISAEHNSSRLWFSLRLSDKSITSWL